MSDFVKALPAAELLPGTGVELSVGGQAVALFNVEGAFYAISNTCLHRGGPLGQGYVEGRTVTCPWHSWTFDVATGAERRERRVEGGVLRDEARGRPGPRQGGLAMSGRLRSVVLLSLSLSAAAVAQDAAKTPEAQKPQDAVPSQEATPTFPAQVEQVIVDLVVMDKKGNSVTDLAQGDVTVTEDGTPQVITSFERVEVQPAPADAKVEKPRVSTNLRPENRTGRTFAVVFDDMHLTPFQSQRAKGAVTNFLETGTAAGDLVTLVATSGAAWWTTRMPQGRDELVATLKRLDGRYIPDTSPERMSDYEAMMIHVFRDSRTIERVNRRYDTYGVNPQGRTSSSNTGGNQTFGADADPQVTARASEVYYSATSRNRSTLDTLERLLNALRNARGRKSLILVSEGFIYDPNLTEYKDVVQAARRSNVAIYFLDTRGLTGMSIYNTAEFGPALDTQDLGAAFTENLEASEVRPMPRQVVEGHVQMPDPRRHLQRVRPDHRQDAEVLHPVRDDGDAPGQLVGQRGFHEHLGGGLVLDCRGEWCGAAALRGALGEGAGGEHGAG